MWYIVRLDSSRVATLVKVRSATRVSSSDPTRVKSNYIPVYTTILRQIERCQYDAKMWAPKIHVIGKVSFVRIILYMLHTAISINFKNR